MLAHISSPLNNFFRVIRSIELYNFFFVAWLICSSRNKMKFMMESAAAAELLKTTNYHKFLGKITEFEIIQKIISS